MGGVAWRIVRFVASLAVIVACAIAIGAACLALAYGIVALV